MWERPLGPGKYAFNTYAGSIVLVPTTNFVLHWITGQSETHRYDESLRSIDLVTTRRLRAAAAAVGRRAHRLPAGAERHPAVRRREEADHADARPDAQSAYFRDIAHKKTMLELLHERDADPGRRPATSCGGRFREFDIECVDVLIGKPDTGRGRTARSRRCSSSCGMRQLSIEQLETYERQRAAAEKLRS